MKDRTTFWMGVTGFIGLTLFIIANATNIFFGLDVIAGLLQLGANVLVFIAWRKGYLTSQGKMKQIALVGTIVPVILGFVTIVRVIIPFLLLYIK